MVMRAGGRSAIVLAYVLIGSRDTRGSIMVRQIGRNVHARDHLLKKSGLPNVGVIDQFEGTNICGIFKNKLCFSKVRCDLSVGMEMCFDMGTEMGRNKV
jgi:hypothetical protein